MQLLTKVFGDHLVKLRTDTGKDRATLAREAGLDYRYLERVEGGRQMPSIYNFIQLAAALDTTPEKLIAPIWTAWLKAGQPDVSRVRGPNKKKI